MASRPQDLVIASLKGGLNDMEPPHLLKDDECMVANNVEFFFSSIAERRKGCVAFDITGSGLAAEHVIGYLTQWFPDNDIAHPEIWAMGVTAGTSTTLTKRSAFGSWSTVVPADPIDKISPQVWGMQTQVLNAKQFFAYKSGIDRLHLWDGDVLRRVGLAQPVAAPTATDEGSGTYATTRYFRIRYIKRTVGGTILVRSEPSDSVAFAPSGSGAGAHITRPALIGESETDWEVEASVDNVTFYKIAIVAAATTTYNDETDLATTDYADLGPLSEDIGTYLLIGSAKFISIDGDRLVFAGNWEDDTKKSQVGWTPVQNDPGVGNDERLPLAFDNTVILDTTDRGEITGISDSTNGTWYVFKWNQIHKFTRTGNVTRAYTVYPLSKTTGAIPGSIVSGIDENGRSCIYALDPATGPIRITAAGLQHVRGLLATWGRVNATATIAARTVYYPDKRQVWWWVAADGSDTPTLMIKLQVSELQSAVDGAHRGFSLADGRIATAYTAAAIHDLTLNTDGNQILVTRPFIGLVTPNCIQRCDLGNDDDGLAFVAKVRTKPFFSAGILNKWGAMVGALLATANATATVKVSFIRDFGRMALDTQTITTGLAAVGTEAYVIKFFDQLHLTESVGIQVEFSDP